MRTGGMIFAAAAVLLTGGCLGEQGKLEVRSIKSPLAAGARPVSFRVAEGRAQYALGNVGLALESFRKAAREDPTSVDALVGIAACYDRMGRFDLSRRNYEAALALAPGDPQALAALAASLELQNLGAEAASVRQEISTRLAASAAPVSVTPVSPAPAAVPPGAQPVASALAPILPTTVANAVAAVMSLSDWPRPATPSARAPALATTAGPRLERLSMGEVALVTAPGPMWRVQREATMAPRPATGARAVRQAVAARAGIRVFNAARVDKLASRARTYLTGRGWSVASVGDVASPRARSIIFYPADKRATAARLAAQFGFAMQSRSDVRQITVVLGRDAASLASLKATSG